jgi:serine/threonine protein kinase
MIDRIARYEIRSELLADEFGRVYRAFDPWMGRQVSIRVLSAELERGSLPQRRWYFAAVITGLSHPNIVRLDDFGQSEGGPYLVTELLDGETRPRAPPNRLSLKQKKQRLARSLSSQ